MRRCGFNLIDISMALLLVGVLSALTIPVLYKTNDTKNLVSELYDFNSTLETSVNKWKEELGCPYNVKVCLGLQKTILKAPADFDKITKFMKVVEKLNAGPSDLYWLPVKTRDYYGTKTSEFDYRSNPNRTRYLLADGKIISVETNDDGFWLLVDVNGKKPPNRIGKDTFHVLVGYSPSNDINYYAREKTNDGICGPDYAHTVVVCDPKNVNPLVGTGANPGAYVLINHALPDYKTLSEQVAGFNP